MPETFKFNQEVDQDGNPYEWLLVSFPRTGPGYVGSVRYKSGDPPQIDISSNVNTEDAILHGKEAIVTLRDALNAICEHNGWDDEE